MSYLAEITFRLAAGAARFSPEIRRMHGDYLAAAIGNDGGFSGRQGRSNAYYTGFGLRGLAMLGRLDAETARRIADFLRRQMEEELSAVDFFSVVMCDKLLREISGVAIFAGEYAEIAATVAAGIERYRCRDGGYAKTSAAAASSVYHTFLALACRELYTTDALPAARAEELCVLIASRRRDDGGYVEIPQMRQSGTNPTAAATAVLQIIGRDAGATGSDLVRSAGDFLARMQTGEGGFRANGRIPVADLLSTFTALTALSVIFAEEPQCPGKAIDSDAARRYAISLQHPAGGFRGGAWDDAADVEYTFYGLGTLALLGMQNCG